jgi:hypothetical protein
LLFVEGGTATSPGREPVGPEHHDVENDARSLITTTRKTTGDHEQERYVIPTGALLFMKPP